MATLPHYKECHCERFLIFRLEHASEGLGMFLATLEPELCHDGMLGRVFWVQDRTWAQSREGHGREMWSSWKAWSAIREERRQRVGY
jgi:hypothetical protein